MTTLYHRQAKKEFAVKQDDSAKSEELLKKEIVQLQAKLVSMTEFVFDYEDYLVSDLAYLI